MQLPEIADQRLRIRAFEAGDIPAFAAAARESVAVMARWMPWCHAAYSEHEARAWIEQCAANVQHDIAYDLGIFGLEDGELYGGIAINQINRQHLLGNIGYWVRATRQRQGVATRAVRLVAGFGFDVLKLVRLEIIALPDNHASRGVALKTGAVFECIARNRLSLRGVPHPGAVYALIPPSIAPVLPTPAGA